MSRFLLDTNIPSELLRHRPDPIAARWVERQVNKNLFLSVITMGELRRGTALLQHQAARKAELERLIEKRVPSWFQDRLLPVTRAIAERWGVLDAGRKLSGRPMNTADGLIAATAIEHGMTLVTRNLKDFVSLGIPLLDPWIDS